MYGIIHHNENTSIKVLSMNTLQTVNVSDIANQTEYMIKITPVNLIIMKILKKVLSMNTIQTVNVLAIAKQTE